MLFKASFIAALALLPSVFGTVIQARDEIDSQSCVEELKDKGTYQLQYSAACVNLIDSCLNTLSETGSTDMWATSSCVAAATCDGSNFMTLAQCQNSDISKADGPHLNYNVFAGIVGECAWIDAGCAITFQNYVDFIYHELSVIGSTEWPESVEFVETYWWNTMLEWAATGETIPYLNFDDWLHYGF